MEKKVLVELTREEVNLLLIGMTSSQFPLEHERNAFNLVLKLRDKLREAT